MQCAAPLSGRCRDGQPGYMGEREPLDNPEPTHGICEQHKAQVLESLPSRSFPDVELLIVVPRNNTAVYERLKGSFGAMSRVKVLVERRVSDRRAASWPASNERRRQPASGTNGASLTMGGCIRNFDPTTAP